MASSDSIRGRMNVSHRIQSLHAGQIAILVALLGVAAAGLLLIRHETDRKRAAADGWIFGIQRELDSLETRATVCASPTVQLADSLARTFNRAMLDGRVSSAGGL